VFAPVPLEIVRGAVKLFPPLVERVKTTPCDAAHATSTLLLESTAITGKPPGPPLDIAMGVLNTWAFAATAVASKAPATNVAKRERGFPHRRMCMDLSVCVRFMEVKSDGKKIYL
jgi:hypothetical protein